MHFTDLDFECSKEARVAAVDAEIHNRVFVASSVGKNDRIRVFDPYALINVADISSLHFRGDYLPFLKGAKNKLFVIRND